MILVFDLDDTLYDEETFVWSGFRAVSRYLEQVFSVPCHVSMRWMRDYYEKYQRQGIFDAMLRAFELYTPTRVQKCVQVYRTHRPEIRLAEDAEDCLRRFRRHALYVVTDGNKTAQAAKIKALGLDKRMKHCFITYRHGVRHAKPSPYCFLKIAALEKVSPEGIVYIGDNPHKDFIGIKPLGFKTIRVLKGPYREVSLSSSYEAHVSVNSLQDVTETLLAQLFLTSFSAH